MSGCDVEGGVRVGLCKNDGEKHGLISVNAVQPIFKHRDIDKNTGLFYASAPGATARKFSRGYTKLYCSYFDDLLPLPR